MKTRILLLVTIIFFTISVTAQSPAYLWAKNAGGTIGGDRGTGCTTDADGNIIATGFFQSSSISFGSTTLTNTGSTFADIFIVKYDSYGNVIWAKGVEGTGHDYVNCCSIDADGNIFVVGYFNSSALTFGSITLTNAGGYDIFIAKYDTNGNVLWAKSAGENSFDYANGCTVDNNGNVIAIGYFNSSSIIFGTTTLINMGNSDIFTVKYDTNGNVIWAKSAGGISWDVGKSVSTDANGDIIVTGQFESTSIIFDSTTLTNVNGGSADVFVAKYNSNGNIIWAKSAGGTSNDEGKGCSSDSNGNIVATGSFYGSSINFGLYTLTNTGWHDMFIVKYDSNGNVLWAKSAGGTDYDMGNDCSIDQNGNIIVTGSFQSSSITFGTTTLTNVGSPNPDIFIVKYDSSGDILWVKSVGGTSNDVGYSCTSDNIGNIILTGYFWSPTLIFGSITLTNIGAYDDMFIAKISRCLSPPPDICLVTVDSLSENNIIVWDKTNVFGADTFFIYRDTANSNYALIGKVPNDSLSQFIDTVRTLYSANGDPNASSWRYKLAVKDTCGTISEMSPYHQTLFMLNNGGTFIWTQYQIEGQNIPVPGLTNYIFQRDNISNGNYSNVISLSASSTLYNDPQFANFPNASYRVMTQWSTQCTATKSSVDYNSSRSNVKGIAAPSSIKEINLEKAISIYPNPNDGSFTIILNNLITLSSSNSITIYNVLGEEVYRTILNSKQKAVNLKLLPGIYQLTLETNSGMVNKKIIIE